MTNMRMLMSSVFQAHIPDKRTKFAISSVFSSHFPDEIWNLGDVLYILTCWDLG